MYVRIEGVTGGDKSASNLFCLRGAMPKLRNTIPFKRFDKNQIQDNKDD